MIGAILVTVSTLLALVSAEYCVAVIRKRWPR